MAQTPPLAVRFKDATLEAIERYRAKTGVSRNKAVTALVEQALSANGFGSPAFERIRAGLMDVVEGRVVVTSREMVRTQGPASQRAEALATRQAAEAERTAGWFNPRSKK